jgi:hypothetical protein
MWKPSENPPTALAPIRNARRDGVTEADVAVAFGLVIFDVVMAVSPWWSRRMRSSELNRWRGAYSGNPHLTMGKFVWANLCGPIGEACCARALHDADTNARTDDANTDIDPPRQIELA